MCSISSVKFVRENSISKWACHRCENQTGTNRNKFYEEDYEKQLLDFLKEDIEVAWEQKEFDIIKNYRKSLEYNLLNLVTLLMTQSLEG